jgi:hypothetical protein
MLLSDSDQAMINGEAGEAARIAMELLLATAEADGANELIGISGAHIDGCLYHGKAGVDFARSLLDAGARVVVPTTLNVSSLDLLHPELYRGDPDVAAAARQLMDGYVAMGCVPSWTCAPYQLPGRPGLGDQIAWGESNAIVFANSVLGARTGRYGDFLDICCALTGRAPAVGLHTDEGRRATLRIDLDLPDTLLDDDLVYPVLGHVVGELAGTGVPVIVGLDERATEDRLKALGAAAASSGAVAMFHVAGVTPEAPTVDTATGGREPDTRVSVGREELMAARAALNQGSGPLGAVSVGTPHFSESEMETLARLASGRSTTVPFYVNTSRDVLEAAQQKGTAAIIERFGAVFVTDTCTYITPVMEEVAGVVMTNSGKWAFYAPGNLGVEVALAGLKACVDSAVSGVITVGEEW